MQLTITGIHPQRRHPERANLHIDGEFCCGVAYEVVLAERLKTGAVVSAAQLARIRAADARWRAKQAALALLAVRARARHELIDRLRARRFDDDAVTWALDEVDRLGLIDDAAFAESWVRDRLRLRPRGARALQAELTRKGVAPATARAVIARVMATERVSEADLCMQAAEKWLRTHGKRAAAPDADGRRRLERRLSTYLQRRGYAGDALRAAVRTVLGD